MNNQANTQHNKLMKLDDTMLMYGIYNAEMFEKLIRTVHEIHTSMNNHVALTKSCIAGNVFRTNSSFFSLVLLMRRPENLKFKYFLEKMTLCDV